MTIDTDTHAGGGGEALAAAEEVKNAPVPKNDAEAEALEQAAKAKAETEPKPEPKEKHKNRTREYIERINSENAELRRRLSDIETRLPKPEAPKAPDPNDFYNDPVAFNDAFVKHTLAEERQRWEKEQQQQAELRKQQESTQAYAHRASAFAAEHEDFFEVVGSIDPRLLTNELQAAVMAQENGPAIAYQLANNPDELWQLATLRADLVPLAIERLSSRLKAAPEAGTAPMPSIPAIQPEPKPISQTPPPAPRVGGRAPTEIPEEKLTDDEWYRRERERQRKR